MTEKIEQNNLCHVVTMMAKINISLTFLFKFWLQQFVHWFPYLQLYAVICDQLFLIIYVLFNAITLSDSLEHTSIVIYLWRTVSDIYM